MVQRRIPPCPPSVIVKWTAAEEEVALTFRTQRNCTPAAVSVAAVHTTDEDYGTIEERLHVRDPAPYATTTAGSKIATVKEGATPADRPHAGHQRSQERRHTGGKSDRDVCHHVRR